MSKKPVIPEPSIKPLAECICRSMVSRPDDIEVDEQLLGHQFSVVIKCHPSDFPKLLGKEQHNLKPIVLILKHAAALQGKEAEVILTDPPAKGRSRNLPYSADEEWTPDAILELLDCIFDYTFSNTPKVAVKNTRQNCTFDIRLDECEQISEERIYDLSIAINRILKVAGNMQGKKVLAGISV